MVASAMGTDSAGPQEPRGHRQSLDAEIGIRRAGTHSFRVRIFDASPEGCKVEFIERPAVGERVWVRFDGLEAIECTVRWVKGHTGGVQFERPLHEAVFRKIAASKKEG